MAHVDFATLKQSLYTAVLSDVLDSLGYMHQAMRPFVRPLDEDSVIMGRARTGLWMNVFAVTEGENPYEHEMALLDDLKPGDVAVFGCGGPTDRVAPWGELLSTAATCRGAEACVTDGLVRDVKKIREMRFPVFHGGIGPLDSKGRAKMVAIDVPIECGGVTVRAGDIVFGDVRRGRDSSGHRRRSDREGVGQGRGGEPHARRIAAGTPAGGGLRQVRGPVALPESDGCHGAVRNAGYGDGVLFAGH
jgi:regulator of RNase E activity RraA